MRGDRSTERVPLELTLNGDAERGFSPRCLEKVLKKQCRRYRRGLKRCQRKLSGKSIHQSRVETRRVLALVALLEGFLSSRTVERVERALKRHLDIFDDLRDTQVQLKSITPLLKTYPAAHRFRAWLCKRQKRYSKRAERGIKRIQKRRLKKLLTRCRSEAAKRLRRCPGNEVASCLWQSVEYAFARTSARHARIDPTDTGSIHRTRVAFKRFRYMVEALLQHCLPADPGFLKALHDYQTAMGDIQDAEVLLRTLKEYLAQHPREAARLGRFQAALIRRRAHLIRSYLRLAGPLDQFWPPKRMAGHAGSAVRSGDDSPRDGRVQARNQLRKAP